VTARPCSGAERLIYAVVVAGLSLLPLRGVHHVPLHATGIVVLVVAALAYRQRVARAIVGSACAILLVDLAYGWLFAKPHVPVEPLWLAAAIVYAMVIAVVLIDDRRRSRLNAGSANPSRRRGSPP